MRLHRPLFVLSLTLFVASSAAAQTDLPAVRSLGQPVDSVLLGMTSTPSVRVLSNGRVLATDLLSRRLIIISEDLKSIDTVFDANSPAPLTYPPGYSPLVAAAGDTTLIYDYNARGYRVIDESGRVVRRQSIADALMASVLPSPASQAVVDAKGRIVVATQRWYLQPRRVVGLQPQAESLLVVRVALDRPGYDSLASIMGSGQHTVVTDSTKQPPMLSVVMPLVDRGDAWTLTSTGRLAIIRSADFHVDWIDADGTRRSSRPVPWSWAKYAPAFRDSLIASREAALSSGNMRSINVNGSGVAVAAPPSVTPRLLDALPERVPAFSPSNIRPDRQGRIWLALGPHVMGPPPASSSTVFAVIDSTGQVVERIELPARRVIAGFDALGYLYAVTSTRGGFEVERYVYRKP